MANTDIILKSIERKNLFTQKVYIKFCCIAVILIFSVMFVYGLLSIFLPKPTVSVYENRNLAVMPKFSIGSLLSGEYSKGVEAFYADTFPYRDKFVNLASRLSEVRGIRIDGIKLHERAVNSNSDDSPASASSQPESQKSTSEDLNAILPVIGQSSVQISGPAQTQSQEAGERYGNVFVYNSRAMSVFGGTKTAGSRYAGVINSYKDILGDRVKVYNMVIPTSIEFYLPEEYKSVSHSQKQNIENIYSSLSPKVTAIDAYSTIEKHTDEYLYFYTDHHWTALCAYYAYTAFANAAGFTPLQLTDFDKGRIENFLGTLYGQTQDQKLKNNLDYVDYYIPRTKYTAQSYNLKQPNTPTKTTLIAEYAKGVSSYSAFLHGDMPLIKVQTENKNGKKIMIVKESFGNAFVPFLTSHYEEIYIADLRYFQYGMIDYINSNNINELLFINNAFAANTNSFINKLENMKYQKAAAAKSAQ